MAKTPNAAPPVLMGPENVIPLTTKGMTPEPPAGAKRVRVTAIRLGFYDNVQQHPGSTFDYWQAEGTKLPLWVRLATPAEAKEPKAATPATTQPVTRSVL